MFKFSATRLRWKISNPNIVWTMVILTCCLISYRSLTKMLTSAPGFLKTWRKLLQPVCIPLQLMLWLSTKDLQIQQAHAVWCIWTLMVLNKDKWWSLFGCTTLVSSELTQSASSLPCLTAFSCCHAETCDQATSANLKTPAEVSV